MNVPHSSVDPAGRRLLYIVDWLPPDFGAVGQYALKWCRQQALRGADIVLAGLTTSTPSVTTEDLAPGRLRIVRLHATNSDKANFAKRAFWTLKTNLKIVLALRDVLLWADDIRFTGSPPFLVHLLAPLNRALGKRLIYRIADFHPECLMATLDRVPLPLELFYKLTVTWRRTVTMFEVLGNDQRRRLLDLGIPPERIVLDRDPSPVAFTRDTRPLPLPAEFHGKCVLLYSGNFGIAHDWRTFFEGYRLHHEQGTGRTVLWLNATGVHAEKLADALRGEGLPFVRGQPVPISELASLLVTPHAHLITIRDSFVGYVMPSKAYGCAASGRDVLFIGSEQSDAHLICTKFGTGGFYQRVNIGDCPQVTAALERLADRHPVAHGS